MLGEIEAGIAQMREGVAARRSSGANCNLTTTMCALAEAQARSGQPGEGLSTLAQALAQVEATDERYCEAEIHRVKGELLLMQGDEHGAEESLRKAIAVARRQEAKALELRATVGLCRLWQKQGRNARAREVLTGVYGWFTEGFDTRDLREARELLEELAEG